MTTQQAGSSHRVVLAHTPPALNTQYTFLNFSGVSKLWKKFVTYPGNKPDYGGYYGEAKFIVVAGDNDRSDGRDDGPVTVAVRKFCVHESYDFNQQRGSEFAIYGSILS